MLRSPVSLLCSAPLLVALLGACGGSSSPAEAGAVADVSPDLSTVEVPTHDGVPSDGVSTLDVVVTVRGRTGEPLADRAVTVTSTGVDAIIDPPTATTDPNGSAAVRIASRTAGAGQLAVMVADRVGGAPTILAATPGIRFVVPRAARNRVSVSSRGDQAQDFSGQAAISGNGRWIAFQSKAPNLVPGDTNQKEDVFVHDLDTRATERVSLTPGGGQFPDLSANPSVSDDGSLIAFDARERDDEAVFVRDRAAGVTLAISDAARLGARCYDPAISGDGRWIACVRDDGESRQIYVIDRSTLATELVSKSSTGTPGDDPSFAPSISRDGRWVAFTSTADNLVTGDSNDKDDVFVHDRRTGRTVRVSVGAGGAEGNDDSGEAAIAADGSHVAFSSKASNFVPGDDNGKIDVFVAALAGGAVTRVSVDPRGDEVDKESWLPDISADGSFVVFSSLSDALVAGDSNGKEDVFRRDLAAGVTVRVSRALSGGDPDEFSTGAALASDAGVVAFTSKAQNLVRDDDNDKTDVFSAPRD